METLQRTANRGSISTGYEIDNSLKLEADNSEYMKRVMTATGNRKTFTISVWLKRTELQAGAADGFGHTFFLGGNGGTGTAVHLRFSTSGTNPDALQFRINTGTDNYTNRRFRDTSAWYHIVLAVDTTQATDSNRLKLYVNGVQETSFATINYPTQNSDTQNNLSSSATYGQEIGAYDSGGTYYGKFCGYLAEYNHVDGQQLAPTEFGETDDDSGIWKPKAYTGTYGTNGFYLDFADAADLGDDESGNGNDFTETNITAANQGQDSPSNNFCTFNPLIRTAGTITEGATKFWNGAGNGWKPAVASMGAGTSGKWYAEFNFPTTAANNMLGQCPIDDPDLNRGETSFPYYGSNTSLGESTGVYSNDGDIYVGGGATDYGTAYGTSDIMSIAIDMDNGKFYVAKNGTYFNSGDPTSGATGTGAIAVRGATKAQSIGPAQYTQNAYMLCNYGGFTTISISSAESDENGYGTFEYAPPSGYYALCTKNLAEYG